MTNVTLCGVPAWIVAQSPLAVVVQTGRAVGPTNGDVVVYSAGYGSITRTNAFTYCLADITTNGTPLWWLDQYGLINDTTDTDGDGMRECDEYMAGTCPTSGASVLAITNAQTTAVSNGGFVVQWPSVLDRTYAVDRTTNLVLTEFAPVATNLPATPPVNVHTDAASGLRNAAYRIRVMLSQ